MMRVNLLFSLVIVSLVSLACLFPVLPAHILHTESTPDTALIEQGIKIYRANYCGSCHTLTVANTRGTFGPNHDDSGAVSEAYIELRNYQGEATNAAEYIRESILNPSIFYTPGYEATNHHMPAFTHLPDEDIEALVYLLVRQR